MIYFQIAGETCSLLYFYCPIIGCQLCSGRGSPLNIWILFIRWQCSEGDSVESCQQSTFPAAGGDRYFGPRGKDLGTHTIASTLSLKRERLQISIVLFFLVISCISMRLWLHVLSAAASAPKTRTKLMGFHILLFN